MLTLFSIPIGLALLVDHPQWLINQENLDRFRKWYAPKNIVFSDDKFLFRVIEDGGLFKKKVEIKFDGIHISYLPTVQELVIPHIELTFDYDLFHKGFITKLGPGNVTLNNTMGATQVSLAAELDTNLHLSGNLSFKNILAAGKFTFGLQEEDVNYLLNTSGSMDLVREHPVHIAFERCSSLIQPDQGFKKIGLVVSCLVNATFAQFDTDTPPSERQKTPYGRFQIDVKTKSLLLTDFSKPTAYHVTVKSQADRGVDGREIDATLDLKGALNRIPELWDVKAKMGLQVDVNEFAELISNLVGTSLSVPAPFNVLKGRAEISAHGRIESIERENEFTYETKLDFSSTGQKIKLTGIGKAMIGIKVPSFNPTIAVELDESQLVFPPLNALSVPQLMPDSRIITEPPKKNIGGFKNYDVTLKNREGTALVIKAQYAASGIPLVFDMHLKPKEISGTVTAKSFDAEFFHSKGHIQSFEFKLMPEFRQSGLKGLIHVDRAAYGIDIQILGNFGRPRIVMESDPPLSQQDIVSLLLYGDTLDELGEGDAQQAKDVRSGISQRAFAFGSLFLFASTPIQKISYDPYTRTAAVKFRLGKGRSLVLKHQDSVQGVSFQQKLTKHLVLTTELNTTFNATQDQSKKAKKGTFIEWFKRY